MASYRLERDGNGRNLVHEGLTKQLAYQLIGQSIYDNGYADKREAQMFASTVRIGSRVQFGPYVFTLTEESS